MPKSDAAKPGAPGKSSLPLVASPALDGSEDAGEVHEQSAKSFNPSPARGSLSRSLRFAGLAASFTLAAALGAMIGVVSASKLASLESLKMLSLNSEMNTLAAIKSELSELPILTASVDGAARSASGQFAKIADRLDRVERAEAEPATKLTHISETVDRLDKRSAAAAPPETTGSIATSQPGPAPAPAASPSPIRPKLSARVVEDWVVQDAGGGHALVASRSGVAFEVETGSVLPGLGRVETIKQQDGQWIVVTAHGIIAER
jgi:hypothetical protein